MSRIGHRHHSPPPVRSSQPQQARAAQAPVAPPAAPKKSEVGPRVQNAPKDLKSTFNRLDRNNDHFVDYKDFQSKDGSKVAGNQKPRIPGAGSDGKLTLKEFRKYADHFEHKPGGMAIPDKAGGTKGKKDPEHKIDGGTVLEVRKDRSSPTSPTAPGAPNLDTGQGATFRSDPSGLVLGRLQPGDRFVATHKQGGWYYGYVNGNPQQKGWVLKNDALKKKEPTPHEKHLIEHPPEKSPKHMVRDNHIARGPDGSNKDGFVTSGEKRYNAVVRDLESRFDVNDKTGKLGYTRPFQLKNDTKLLAGLDGKALRDSAGKPITLPKGSTVNFRYTPDGEHAVVSINRPDKKSGLWAVVKKDDIDLNGLKWSEVAGGTRPGKPIG